MPFEVELMRGRRDHKVGECGLAERLEALHVDARELGGLGDLHDVAGEAERGEVEARRQRFAIDEAAVQAVAHVDQE